MATPEYRILVRIYDRETDTTIALEDAPMMEDRGEAETQLQRVFAGFDRRKTQFEETYYPKETNDTNHEPSSE